MKRWAGQYYPLINFFVAFVIIFTASYNRPVKAYSQADGAVPVRQFVFITDETLPPLTQDSPIFRNMFSNGNVVPSTPSNDNASSSTDNPAPVIHSDNTGGDGASGTQSLSDNEAPLFPLGDNTTAPSGDNTTTPSRVSQGVSNEPRLLEKHKVFPVDRIIQVLTADVGPDRDAEITSGSGKIKLKMPAAAVNEPVEVELAEYTPIDSSGMRMLNLFELTAANAGGYEVSKFKRNLEISIQHNTDDLKGLNVDSLRLYYLDEETRQWLPVENSHYDKETRVLTAQVSHFTNYGEQADPLVTGPGRVMAAQVDLHSGAVNFNYPFELPPGPGDFQPKVELAYNSSSVDEMKNKRDVGSWVGIGWSLQLGKITKDLPTSKYYLDLNGASYELIQDGTSSNWYTNPDGHFKITRSGDTWELLDQEGYYYKLGANSDAIQYLPSGEGGNYRWDLSQFRDIDGHTDNVTYVQNIQGTLPNQWVRSAYPEYLRYGYNNSIEVRFISSDNRTDNPAGSTVAAPKIMEDRRLDAIDIKVNGTRIRKYEFTYQTRDDYYSSDYGGIYYAGKHVLTSVTQIGANGTSKLPPVTFSYRDLPTYRHTTEGDYVGNPGNAAIFSWPHLTAMSTGYGGKASFTYTQLPTNNPNDIWTREIITGKTVNSGIGASQSYVYTYPGNPEYNGTGWDQKYRGFREVRDTDAENNYVQHYYYTTGTINGKSADNVTGKEYQTKFYDANNVLLTQKSYDWDSSPLTLNNGTITQFWRQWLVSNNETIGSKSSRTRLEYDSNHINVITEYRDGDLSTYDDDSTVWRVFSPNTTLNILSKPARERIYSGNATSDNGTNLKAETLYYYDGNNTSDPLTTAPSAGHLTRLQQKSSDSSSINTYFTYDTYGNMRTTQSPNSDNTTWEYDNTNTYPTQKTSAGTGLAANLVEHYTYDTGTNNKLTEVDYNGQTTTYVYDTFKRLTSVTKPGDTSPSIEYQYNNWGIINQQHIKILTRVSDNDTLWQKDYFDGLGKVVQSQSRGDPGHIIVSGTNTYNARGLVVKSYIAQYLPVSDVNGYKAPEASWKYASYTYDGLGRVITQTNPDGTSVSNDYSTAWRNLGTNERGYKKASYNDAFGRLIKVEEYNASDQLYATTTYTYDVRGNLKTVTDNATNTTTINYDWLSRKTSMSDPDMGTWSYSYDYNGNLISQTDAKNQTIDFTYDALNRLTAKTYHDGVTANVTYSYDAFTPGADFGSGQHATGGSVGITIIAKLASGDNYGKGRRTAMTDALGTTTYKYDKRGRMVEEKRRVSVNSTPEDFVTKYSYDNADRVTNIIYPTSENVTQTYSRRSLPYSLSGNVTGSLVTGTLYNYLGQVTDINFGNNKKTSFGYWGTGGSYDNNSSQSFGQLWEIQTYSYTAGSTQGGTLTVSANTGGTVSSSNGTYGAGAVVIITATPNSDYEFTRWSDNVTTVEDTASANTTVTMRSNYTISANFQSTIRTLTVNSTSGGSATGSGSNYHKGDVVQLVATPNDGYTFQKWVGDTAGIADVYAPITSVKVNKNTIVTAQFSSITHGATATIIITANLRPTSNYDLRVNASYGGNVTSPGLGIFSYAQDTSVNLTAAADTGYHFVSWIGDVASANSTSTTVTMDSYKTVVANFAPNGSPSGLLQDVKHTWDAGGNLTIRENVTANEIENFTYDFLDRLTGVSGAYSESYSYNALGNILTKNGSVSYTYNTNGIRPHAVTQVGSTSYAYDANGNMTTRGAQTITWDAENRPLTVTGGASFVYDGDGNRVKKTENGQTIFYINKYYEKNLDTGEIITYYYHGDRLVASRKASTLRYHYQDHITGTSLMTDSNGSSTITYKPFGETRTGSVPTDKKFTGQRLDGTGLYFYNARYYDPSIGRFISSDTVVQDYSNPQTLNRYSYVQNNPLKYNDPTGHIIPLLAAMGGAAIAGALVGGVIAGVTYAMTTPKEERTAGGWAGAIVGGAVGGAAGGAVIALALAVAPVSVPAGIITAAFLAPAANGLGFAIGSATGSFLGDAPPGKWESLAWASGFISGPANLIPGIGGALSLTIDALAGEQAVIADNMNLPRKTGTTVGAAIEIPEYAQTPEGWMNWDTPGIEVNNQTGEVTLHDGTVIRF